MIRVKLYNLLAERSLSGREEYEIRFEDGLRPVDVIHREGFHGDEEEAIVVLVNDEQATRQMLLSDGDRVELMINMVGGSAGVSTDRSKRLLAACYDNRKTALGGPFSFVSGGVAGGLTGGCLRNPR